MTKLDRTWKNCLRMWKDVVEECGKEQSRYRAVDKTVDKIKKKWLKKHGFTRGRPYDCFFCEHAVHAHPGTCEGCPGQLVSAGFSCMAETYHYFYKPKAFYAKLLELNRKRSGEKKC